VSIVRDPSRPHRRNFNEPGHAHELTFSCYHRFPFLSRHHTREWFFEALDEARTSHAFDLWAYVVMPDHAHVVIRPREPVYDVARIRRAIKAPVGRRAIAFLEAEASEWIPRITRRRGRRTERLFWQSGGGYDRNVTDPATLATMIDYVHRNPVRAGLVERAVDWEWSTARWFVDGTEAPLRPDPIPCEWGT
jgi:putative transposase